MGGSEPQLLTPFPANPADPAAVRYCSKSRLPSRRGANFPEKVASHRDETTISASAPKVGLPSRRNASAGVGNRRGWQPEGLTTGGAGNRRGPWAQGPMGPWAQGPKGPRAQGPTGPRAHLHMVLFLKTSVSCRREPYFWSRSKNSVSSRREATLSGK